MKYTFVLFFLLLAVTACSLIGSPREAVDPVGDATLAPTPALPPTDTSPVEPTGQSAGLVAGPILAALKKPFQLRLGQTALIKAENLEITYAEFIEDNRCPADLACEWPGEIVISLNVVKQGQNLGNFRLGTYDSLVTVNNYAVAVVEATDDYLFTLLVSKNDPIPSLTTPRTVAHTCEYGYSDYMAPQRGNPEVHIIGVYEASAYEAGQPVIDIYVQREGQLLVLVLSAYESTTWRIHKTAGVTIKQVILNGYGHHQAIGVDDVPLLDRSGMGNYISSSAYSWSSDQPDDDTSALVAEVERLTGTVITSFRGCYRASEFTLA